MEGELHAAGREGEGPEAKATQERSQIPGWEETEADLRHRGLRRDGHGQRAVPATLTRSLHGAFGQVLPHNPAA